MHSVDVVVVGAGVIGLAIARSISLKPSFAGKDVFILEAENAIGTGTSSRNSEVIHAGIYYPFGSLKAKLCVDGRHLLYSYLDCKSLPYRKCGKLIVATSESQLAQLIELQNKGSANGVTSLQILNRSQAIALEPEINCYGALLSPETGIVDSHSFMVSLRSDFELQGGHVVFNSKVIGAVVKDHGFVLQLDDGSEIFTKVLINSAGLNAISFSKNIRGLKEEFIPDAYYAKGNYFSLAGKSPFSRLIYPVPESAGLGVHLTIDLAGQAKFGPDVEWIDDAENLQVDPQRGAAFYSEIRKYWPGLKEGALHAAYAGIRPKLHSSKEAAKDFYILGPNDHGINGLINLFGMESPGLTSSLSIADFVSGLINL
jgi:L-2-hydroxyglutarate oxidase LhgO